MRYNLMEKTYLRPQEIAKKLGTSVNFVREILGKAKVPEQKREDGKTLFEYEAIVRYIQIIGR